MANEILDSRRMTGPNLLLDGVGAAVEVRRDANACDEIDLQAWEGAVRQLQEELGWPQGQLTGRPYPGGATLALAAPEDLLFSACEVNEVAWRLAVGELDREARSDAIIALQASIRKEANPRRARIAEAAVQRRLRFLADDEWVTVGSGKGCQSWPVADLPQVDEIDWGAVSDIAVALITGTNGKTTTVRMLASIAAAAGLRAGNTSTDGVQVDGQIVLHGDYTGGEGARAVLRDPSVDIAFLEIARGGMLRRGLPVDRAEAAYVSNVGNDHLGEYGIVDLDALATVKLLVAKAVHDDGRLIVNVDDRHLSAGAPSPYCAITRNEYGAGPAFGEHLGRVGAWQSGTFVPWAETADLPASVGGAAVHNTYNALGAMAVADALGIARRAIVEGLVAFESDAQANPGRCNLFEFGGVRAIADFAHNPEGVEAALSMARALGPKRLLVVLGQAGDRDDAAIDGLARAAWDQRPDCVVLKEMSRYLRGRAPGEVVERLAAELLRCGAPDAVIERTASEADAVEFALTWGTPGDVLLLLLHADRARTLQQLSTLQTQGWRPGQPLPGPDKETDDGHGHAG